jgi:hypothetical protein
MVEITQSEGIYTIIIETEDGCKILQDVDPSDGEAITTQARAEEIRDILLRDIEASKTPAPEPETVRQPPTYEERLTAVEDAITALMGV